MEAYRLIDVNPNDEIIFGIDNLSNSGVIKKINSGLKTVRPWNHCVPYYEKSRFAFNSLNCFKYFLFGICKLTYADIEALDKLGYRVQKLDLEIYSKGLSKLYCTYFDDEIVELNEISLLELFNDADSISFRRVNTPECPPESVKYTKERFYANVKFHS